MFTFTIATTPANGMRCSSIRYPGKIAHTHIRTFTRTHMKNAFLLFGLLSASIACFSAGEAADTAPPHLDCFLGPTTKVFGKSNSLTYSCSDGKSLALASAPGNPAFPFAFLLHEKGDVYRVYGEGAGSKAASRSVLDELSLLTVEERGTIVKEMIRSASQAKSKK